MTPALAVDDLRVARGGEPVLDGVSLTAATGAVVGLIGPNGAGKTTLLRACNGSLDPDAGTIRIVPASGSSEPLQARRSVVLPAPLGPIRPTTAPVAAVSETPSSTGSPPRATRRSSTASAGVTGS